MRCLYKTDIERKMGEALEQNNIQTVYNFPIRCKYGYILDFAIPELKIDIECDGEVWHKEGNLRDHKRNMVLISKGWIVLRFRGKQILENTEECIKKIQYTITRRLEKNE